jgi:ferredoxin
MGQLTMPKLRVHIDQDRCIGSAGCVNLAPAHFALSEEGKACVRHDGSPCSEASLGGLSTVEADGVGEAAMFCPPEAIRVWDDETGEQLFP